MKAKTIAALVVAALLILSAFILVRDMLGAQRTQIYELNALLSVKDDNERLQAEIELLRNEMYETLKENRLALEEMSELTDKLKTAEMLAGLTDVHGSGVTVTLSDSKNNSVVHDSDLLMIVNELRDAGAEALSINGERILATSEIRCAGSIVSINNSRYSVPFVVKAVGNAETMYNALYMKGGVLDVLGQWKLGAVVEKNDKLVIEAYDGSAVFVFAKTYVE